jgi:hypothetical protein
MWESGFERDWLIANGLQLRERAETLGQRDISRQADGWGALPYFDASSADLAAGALYNMEMQLDALEAEIESLERGKLFGGPPGLGVGTATCDLEGCASVASRDCPGHREPVCEGHFASGGSCTYCGTVCEMCYENGTWCEYCGEHICMICNEEGCPCHEDY